MSIILDPIPISELPPASTPSGIDIIVGDQGGATVTFTLDQLAAFVSSIISSSSKVTNETTIGLLVDTSNWTENLYTGTTILGQNEGDWYDSGTHRFLFITSSTISRIPYQYL